jgi:hypothetical protein
MMKVSDLRDVVVVPTLTRLGLASPAAVALVLGTAVQESGLDAIDQHGPHIGPGRGFWQIEALTHADVTARILTRYPNLHERLSEIVGLWPTRTEQLATNLCYGAAICRLKYYLDPAPLPADGDLPGLAALWKRVYNTPLGHGTAEQWLKNYQTHVAEIMTA